MPRRNETWSRVVHGSQSPILRMTLVMTPLTRMGGAGRDSDGDLGDTPPISLVVPRGKDPLASKSGHELENSRKGNADPLVGRSSASKKGKQGHPPSRKLVPRVTRAAAQKGRQ